MPLTDRPDYEVLNEQMYARNIGDCFSDVMQLALPIPSKPILEWSEQTLSDPKTGMPYDRRNQPATALLLELLDSDYWRSCMLLAPNQAGKSYTLVQFLLHINFNLRENAIAGMPDLDGMWRTKWLNDILPVVKGSSLRDMVPKSGSGSDGGVPKLVLWNNNTFLHPMGAGGGDSQRAGATTRYLAITEVKDFGDASTQSQEGSKYSQLYRRTLRWSGQELVFAESTVTTDDNIAWRLYVDGTQSMPHFPCEACEEFIAPEREHLVGWQGARTEEEAREKTMFSCPTRGCGVLIPEHKRRQLLQEAKVLHRGQTVDSGQIIGPVPPTRSLSYRFTASTNMFANAGEIGVREWKLQRLDGLSSKDSEDRFITQSFFAMPTKSANYKVDPLDSNVLMKRAVGGEFGIVPKGYTQLWGGVDIRKTQLHWTVIATGEDLPPVTIQWMEVRILQDIDIDEALMLAAKEVQGVFRNGFLMEDTEDYMPVTLTLMDSGWKDQVVFAACDKDDFWLPVKAFGAGVLSKSKYRPPDKTGSNVKFIGDGFDVKMLDGRFVVHSDANEWKSRLHESLRVPVDSPRALLFADAPMATMREMVHHLTSEKEEFSGESGESRSIFVEKHGKNHFLDSTSYANLARGVWEFLQELLGSEEEDDGRYTVIGSGPLFGN